MRPIQEQHQEEEDSLDAMLVPSEDQDNIDDFLNSSDEEEENTDIIEISIQIVF